MFGNRKQMGRWIAIAAAIGLFSAAEGLAAKPPKPPADDDPVTYTLVELSATKGAASAVNQLDEFVEVVGRLWDNSGEAEVQKAHYWMVDSAGNVLSMELQTLPPTEPGAVVSSQATDVNDQGVVVGYQRDGSGPLRPVLWPDAADAPVELPLPEESVEGAATSINEAGIVVGRAYSPDNQSLVAWKVAVVDGVVNVLDTQTILSAPSVYGSQVVNSGYVSATLGDPTLGDRAFRLMLDWDEEHVWEVPGSRTQLFDTHSQAAGVNEEGTVCGRYTHDGQAWAFAMNVAGDLLDLPELPGGRIRGQPYEIRNRFANALNNICPPQVIGQANIVITETLEYRGAVDVLWNAGVSALDITPEQTAYVYDINDASWIVGTAPDDEVGQVPVVLIPSR